MPDTQVLTYVLTDDLMHRERELLSTEYFRNHSLGKSLNSPNWVASSSTLDHPELARTLTRIDPSPLSLDTWPFG